MKLKKGDKVYFTKESAPNFNQSHITIGKEYEVIDYTFNLFDFISDNGVKFTSNIVSKFHLNGGTWLKVKTKKRKLEKKYKKLKEDLRLTNHLYESMVKEREELHGKLETTEQLLKVSDERVSELEKDFKSEMLAIAYTSLQKLGVVNWSIDAESGGSGNIYKHTFELTINN